MTSSNNNKVKQIKLLVLQKLVLSAPSSINFKINSGENHHFQKISSTKLPQQPTYNYNPAAQVIVPNIESMVSSTNTHIPIPSLPLSATNSHGFNHLESGSTFWADNPTIIIALQFLTKKSKNNNSTEVSINALHPTII